MSAPGSGLLASVPALRFRIELLLRQTISLKPGLNQLGIIHALGSSAAPHTDICEVDLMQSVFLMMGSRVPRRKLVNDIIAVHEDAEVPEVSDVTLRPCGRGHGGADCRAVSPLWPDGSGRRAHTPPAHVSTHGEGAETPPPCDSPPPPAPTGSASSAIASSMTPSSPT